MKVVLDSNVIIAAYATQGLCYLVFEIVIAHHSLMMSKFLMQEIDHNLKTKLKLPEANVKDIGLFLRKHSVFFKDEPVAGIYCRDKDDIKVLSLAVNSQADVIISGDQDLLSLKKLKNIAIFSPRECWFFLRAESV